MYEEIESEFANFKRDIDEGALTFGSYFDISEYEYDYSRREIDIAQIEFFAKVKKYLRANAPNKYIAMLDNTEIIVMTIEKAKKENIIDYESSIVG